MAKRVPVSINDTLADAFTSHAVDLLRYAESTREDVLDLLVDLQNELTKRLRGAGLNTPRTDWQAARLERLLQQTKVTIATAYREIHTTVNNSLSDLGDVVNTRTNKLLKGVFGDDLPTVAIPPAELAVLVDNTLVQGAIAKDWWGKQSDDTAHRFATQMRLGLAQGETVNDLSDRVEASLEVSQTQATTLVRTSANSVGNAVLDQTYQDNDDIVKGRQAIVTLDGRTSDICISRSNGMWDMEGNPLPDSPVQIRYPGPPSWHFNCRTVIVPIIRSWNELMGTDIEGLDSVPDTTRASMDGQVAGNPSYEEWLKTKPEEFQREVLGPGKYRVWKEGNLGLTQMVDQTGNSLTLAELRKKAGMGDD